jgi:hypothetical protein
VASGFPAWECDLLTALGAPCSQNNLLALNYWAQSEGSVTNNPLATSGKGKGATTCVAQCGSTSPIYEYDTEADGVAQMANFLKGGYYTAIVRAFAQDSGLAAIWQAINNSPWCKGCQSGTYPEALYAVSKGSKIGVSSGVGAGGQGAPSSNINPQGATSGQGTPGAGLSQCVFQLPGFLFFSGPCFITKGGVKWLSGFAALTAGSLVGAFGVILLAATVFDASGAKQSVAKVAGALPGPTGQVVRRTGAASARSTPARSSSPAPRPAPAPEPQTAGRIESRQIERRYRETERQQGPIGPRGGSRTSTRVARDQRQGRSIPGPGSAERRRRAQQPF